MRPTIFLLVLLLTLGAQSLPIRIGDGINLIAPAAGADGRSAFFAAATAPDGTPQKATNLYYWTQGQTPGARRLTGFTGDVPYYGVTGISYPGTGNLAGFTSLPGGGSLAEEVHVIDVASGLDRTVAIDKEGCVRPLAPICVSCFSYCVGPVHLSADAGKVLYAVARQQPLYTVNADGTGLTRLPLYQGGLAASPQRVISRGGLVVFTSAAPFGPTLVAAATDVYTMKLDGTDIRQVTKLGSPSAVASSATISQDGSLIAFSTNYAENGPPQGFQIWVVKPDGSGLRRLTNSPDGASEPSISGDGSVVTFVQGGQIQRANTNDRSVLALTKLSISVPQNPVVSEDGKQVVFSLRSLNGTPAAVLRIPTDSTTLLREAVSIYQPRVVFNVRSAVGWGPASPGSLISVYGANFGPDELVEAKGFPLPSILGGVALLVNGNPVPLLAVTPWQINAQLPQNLAASTTTSFQVRFAGGDNSPATTAEVVGFSPENFWFGFTNGQIYYPQAAAFHPGTAIPADRDHPATAGEILEIYGLGLGATDPAVEAGAASPYTPPARARRTPRVQIGGRDAAVTFAGLTPGLAGVYQINVVVPNGLTSGQQTLFLADATGTIYSNIAVK